MASPDLFTRIRQARLFQVLAVYLGASWIILQVTNELRDALSLPRWVSPVAVILLLIGLVVVVVTAWVQAVLERARRADELHGIPAPSEEARDAHPLHRLTWARALVGGVVAFGLLFGSTGAWVLWRNQFGTSRDASGVAPAIAVVPFNVTGPGLGVWREGMVDLLSTNLDGAAGLRTIDSRTVLARWREQVDSTSAADLKTTLGVAQGTGATYALVGSAVGLGSNVRLSASVYEIASGKLMVSAQQQGAQDSIMSLVDQLSIDVVRAIAQGRSDNPLAVGHLSSVTTKSLPALKAFLEGEAAFRPADFVRAISAYERALETDSTFPLALHRLATAYGWQEDISSARGAEYERRALALIDRLPAREAFLVRGEDGMSRGALDVIPLLEQAVARYPDDPEAWYLLGDVYFHLGELALIEPTETVRALQRALALDPGFTPAYPHLIDTYVALGDSAGASKALREFQKRAPTSEFARAYAPALALAYGTPEEMSQARRALDTLPLSYISRVNNVLFARRTMRAYEDLARVRLARREPGPGTPFAATLGPAVRGRRTASVAALGQLRLRRVERIIIAHLLLSFGSTADPSLEAEFGVSPLDSLDATALLLEGAHAEDKGRSADAARIGKHITERAQKRLASGDSVAARRLNGAARALGAYAVARRGRPAEAIPALKEAQREFTGGGFARYSNIVIRSWIGEAYAASGNVQEAIRYYRSLPIVPLAPYRLGDLYALAGDPEKARASYAEFLELWSEADADLPQPAHAREALLKLSADRPR